MLPAAARARGFLLFVVLLRRCAEKNDNLGQVLSPRRAPGSLDQRRSQARAKPAIRKASRGRIPLDNNRAENALRVVALGWKNFSSCTSCSPGWRIVITAIAILIA